jgi:hypothetical protein
MAKQTRSYYGWRWSLVLLGGLSWLSLGCSPQSLSMFLMPFADNKVDPEFKLFASNDKEITLVVMANFKDSQYSQDLRDADAELAKCVAQAFRKRCEANKHKLKLIPQAQVRALQLGQLAKKFEQSEEGDSGPVEIGRKLKADYVLQLDIEALRIYEPRSRPKMFHAGTQINVNLYKMKTKNADDDNLLHQTQYQSSYPKEGPISAENGSEAQFRRTFFEKAAQEISRMFIAYPPEEKRQHDD